MSITSAVIYSRGSDNVTLRYWQSEVSGDKWRAHFGVVGGKDTVSGWKTCEAKNVGRSNALTPEEQATAEAFAEEGKKLKREFRRTPEELDDVAPMCMLAKEYEKLAKPLRFSYVAEQPKLDGIRFISNAKGGYSRELQPFYTTGHIQKLLAPVYAKYPDLILDGELYNHLFHDDFNKVSSLIRKKSLTSSERSEVEALVQYHIYDAPSSRMFVNRNCVVRDIFTEFDFALDPIIEVPTTWPDSFEALDAAFVTHLENGYEGQMVRQNEEYGFGLRPWSLLKRKVFKTEEFPLTRIIEGTGNWAGYAKGVEFMMPGDARAEDGNRPKASVKGDQAFCKALLTADPKPSHVTIRYLNLTPGGVPRGPVAVDFHYGGRVD